MREMFEVEKTKWLVKEGLVRCVQMECSDGYKTYVTETPAGLCINGDQQPTTLGYHCHKKLGWLANASGDYMHSKFLREVFSSEKVEEDLRFLLKECEEDLGSEENKEWEEERKDEIREIKEMLGVEWECWGELYDTLSYKSIHWDEPLGYGYEERDCKRLDEIAKCVRWLIHGVIGWENEKA